jgi:CRISPR-associated endonuclease/helicase Cas3
MSTIDLWPHQQRAFDLLSAGENIILQAPTGSGKTRAALYPFLVAQDYQSGLHNRFPHKCIYSVPMRVLAKQFRIEYEKTVLRYNRQYGLDISIAIQTGDQPRDPLLASDLVFATIDQTLSRFLLAPYSLSHSKANLNAAAVMGSYLVFDEFHLYDPISTLPTTLHMLKMLQGITPFILMTATFSTDMLSALADLLGATVVPNADAERDELRTLKSQQKTRRYHMIADPAQPLSACSVLDTHDRRSLVICITVDRARQIHQELTTATQNTNTSVLLLHSRFLREDRDRIEDRIRAAFGKDDLSEGSLIVVSTQAIEVGVDITCTRLHTELAPANAILQRAGRCARYPGDEGDVFVYQYASGETPDETVDLIENVMPYKDQQAEFLRTRDAFRDRDGDTLNFTQEQDVITAVHGPRDRQIIDQLRITDHAHRRRMFGVMRGDDRQDAPNLIRDIWQQQVTIHENPDVLLEGPFDVPSFGLHPGTLQKYVKRWLEQYDQDESIPWAIKWLKEDHDPDAEQANRRVYRWIDVHEDAREVWGASLIVVHPRLATYHPQLGFLPDQGGTWQAPIPARQERSSHETYTYCLETYERHIDLVWEAAFDPRDGVWQEMEWAAHRLERRFGWTPDSVRRAAELAILLHDVGKLNVKWQRWVQGYQQRIGSPVEAGQVYAHTDSREEEHRDIEKHMPRRPWHAVEGAIAAEPVLWNALKEQTVLVKAAYSAIARHHAPHSFQNQQFQLGRDALVHVAHVLSQQGFDQFATELVTSGQQNEDWRGEYVIDPNDDPQQSEIECFLTYLLLVRVLRRADQEGTKRGARRL